MRARFSKIAALWRERGTRQFAYDGALFVALELASSILAPFRRSAHGQAYYEIIEDFVARVNGAPKPRVLELGSRNVTGVRHRTHLADHVELLGVDVQAGPDVDVVADAHALASQFEPESFDAVYAISVFEHLAMPWKVILEISRVLKPGGLLLIATHPAWPPHELPWDFWRFSPEAMRVLLNEKTGFELLRCGEGEPGRMLALADTVPVRRIHRSPVSFAVAALAKKVGDPDTGLRWDLTPGDVLDSEYRSAKDPQSKE